MRYGNFKLSNAVATVVFALGTQQLAAQTAPIGTVLGDVTQEKGVVTAVNLSARTVTVKGYDGVQKQLTAPLSVQEPRPGQGRGHPGRLVCRIDRALRTQTGRPAGMAATTRGVTAQAHRTARHQRCGRDGSHGHCDSV